MRRSELVLSFATMLSLVSLPLRADRRNPLEGQPSIRHRVELRTLRFEATPMIGFTVLQDFNNTFYGGVKLEYHLSDWLSIGGAFAGGTAIGTGLKTTILDTLKDQASMGGPPRADAQDAMNHITWWAATQAEFTPFGGKFAVFSKAFLNYDLYVDGGAGFVGLDNSLGTRFGCNMSFGCNTGVKIGPTVAAGLHMFFNDWMAFDLSWRTIIIKDNPAGRDVNGDQIVTDDDLGWSLKQFVSLGLAFYLPIRADISR